MFYAMVFYKNEFGFSNARALRVSPYKTLKGAIKAIEKKKLQGYVKKIGTITPIWQNLASEAKVEQIKASKSIPMQVSHHA
jgi:CRISPR/Cas system-associated protein Cas5 (RAMP superfamily)